MENVCALLDTLLQTDITDGAKATYLVFLNRFLRRQPMPSYTELAKIRGVYRATIQTHVGELERAKLISSVRLPNNRKVYLLRGTRKSPATDALRVERVERGALHPHEALRYFTVLYVREGGTPKPKKDRSDYVQIKRLLAEHGAVVVTRCMDVFAAQRKRRGWGSFTVDSFTDQFPKVLACARVTP